MFGFYKQKYGDIFMFFNSSYNVNTKISYEFYKININKTTYEISDYISQQNLKESKFIFLNMRSYIGKIHILISNKY